MARILRNHGKPQDSLLLLTKAEENCKKSIALKPVKATKQLRKLSSEYEVIGETAAAISCLELVLEISKKELGSNYLYREHDISSLIACYEEQGNLEKCAQLEEELNA